MANVLFNIDLKIISSVEIHCHPLVKDGKTLNV